MLENYLCTTLCTGRFISSDALADRSPLRFEGASRLRVPKASVGHTLCGSCPG